MKHDKVYLHTVHYSSEDVGESIRCRHIPLQNDVCKTNRGETVLYVGDMKWMYFTDKAKRTDEPYSIVKLYGNMI